VSIRPNWYEGERRGRSLSGLGSDWSGFRWILTLNCVVFALQYLLQVQLHHDPLAEYGALRAFIEQPPTFANPEGTHSFNWFFPLQLVTYAFLHANIGHIFWNMIWLWIFSPEVEALLGRARYLWLYITGAIVGGLLQWGWWQYTGYPGTVVGASGAVYSIMVLSALKWPHRTVLVWFILPVPVWLLAIVCVGGDLSGFVNSTAGEVAVLAHLGGAMYGLIYHLRGDMFSRMADQHRRHKAARQAELLNDDRREMDRILAKIQANGLNSLDGSERTFLERRSREMRDKGR
jgi:membrane associated rhomboid family serine protease